MSIVDSTIPVKQAIAIALGFLGEVLGDDISSIRLEEVEFVEADGPRWLVTVSFKRKDPESLAERLTKLANGEEGREFKSISIDAITGTVPSMKIRTFP